MGSRDFGYLNCTTSSQGKGLAQKSVTKLALWVLFMATKEHGPKEDFVAAELLDALTCSDITLHRLYKARWKPYMYYADSVLCMRI